MQGFLFGSLLLFVALITGGVLLRKRGLSNALTLVLGIVAPPLLIFAWGAVFDILDPGGGDMSGPGKMMAVMIAPFSAIAGLVAAVITVKTVARPPTK